MSQFALRFLVIVTAAGVFALAATSCRVAHGQWGGRACPVGPTLLPMAAQAQTPAPWLALHWSAQPDGWWHLYDGPQIKGAYHPDRGYHQWISYGVWGPATTCPVTEPRDLKGKMIIEQPPDDWKTHGVIAHKVSEVLKVTRKGVEISVQAAEQAIEQSAGQLVDDSLKPTMVVVGLAGDRQRVKDVISSSQRLKDALKAWKTNYAGPDAFFLKDWPQVKTGTPWITFHRTDKKLPKKSDIVHELPTLATGATAEPDLFAALQEATQRLSPDWKPAPPPTPKAPDPKQPNVNPNNPAPFDAAELPPWLWLVAGAALLAVILRLRGNNAT